MFRAALWQILRRMDTVAITLLVGFAVYVALGLALALGFVIFGVTQVTRVPVTIGARVLIFPGAAALWPVVLARWRKARGVR